MIHDGNYRVEVKELLKQSDSIKSRTLNTYEFAEKTFKYIQEKIN